MKSKGLLLLLLVITVVILTGDLSFAQPPPPALPIDVDQAPIDGGLGLLAAGGATYAWRKFKNKTKG
jgi:hypothetical protein